MNTKLLLTASAMVMGVLGIAATFAPVEIAGLISPGSATASPLLVQIAGALLLGFSMVNWMARGSLLGGIYNRPIAVGNVAHFVIGGLALAKGVAAGERHAALVITAVIYAIFAVGFSVTLFRSPLQVRSES